MSIEDRRQLHHAEYQLQQLRAEIANITTQRDDRNKLWGLAVEENERVFAEFNLADARLTVSEKKIAKLTRALTRIRDDFLTATHSREVAKEALDQ